MEQNIPALTPLVTIESLTRLWKSCRLIGIINKIFCYFIMIILVVNSMIIVTHCNYCSSDLCQNLCTVSEEQPGIVLISVLTMCLFLTQLITVNNYLRSTNMPLDGTNVKVWIRHHKVLFLIFVLCITINMYLHSSKSTFDIFCIVFLIAGIFKELLVVEKFYESLRIFHLIRQFTDHS